MAIEEKIEMSKIVSKYNFGQISGNMFMNFSHSWHSGICNCITFKAQMYLIST